MDDEFFPVRLIRGLLTGVIEGGSQFLSLATFGWWNPFRSPKAMLFLSTSSRAGRGQERGSRFWELVARPINFMFRSKLLDGKGDHCGRSWRGYQRHRGLGGNDGLGVVFMTLMGAFIGLVFVLG